MQRIIIDHFGPIEHLDLEIKDLTILIGPNAGGKSLVGKLVYFGWTVWERLAETAYFQFEEILSRNWENVSRPRGVPTTSIGITGREATLQSAINHHFDQVLTVKPGFNTRVTFSYGDHQPVLLVSADPFPDIHFEESALLPNLWKDMANEFNQKTLPKIVDYPLQFPQDGKQKARLELLSWVQKKAASLFGYEPGNINLYIPPAKHSTLYVNPKVRRLLKPDQPLFEDHLTEDFAHWVEGREQALKGEPFETQFGKEFPILIQKMKSVLKGDLQIDPFNEQLYVVEEKNKLVPISSASSGQKELAGIFLSLFGLLNISTSAKAANERVGQSGGFHTVLEEPEAHLYPVAQQELVHALSLFLNYSEKNTLIINTHSPYIMTAFDNLITAAETARERPDQADKVRAIVPEEMWIAYDRVSAIYLEDGKAITGDEDSEPGTILDQERRSLSGSRFDRSGDEIEKVFGELLEIRYPIEENA